MNTISQPLKTLIGSCLVACLAVPAQGQVTDSFTEPFERRNVAAAEPGAIATVQVEEGQQVKAGEVLAELQAADLHHKLQLAKLRAQSVYKKNSAQARLLMRAKQRDALIPMLQQGHANQAEVEIAKLEHEVALAELEAALQEIRENEIQCDLIEAEIERRTIRSPIDGVVINIRADSGEYISAAEPSFAAVAQLDRLRVRFYLLTPVAEELVPNQSVRLLLGSSYQQSCEASVHFVSPVTDPDSGTTRVDVVIENPGLKIRSGIPCRWAPNN